MNTNSVASSESGGQGLIPDGLTDADGAFCQTDSYSIPPERFAIQSFLFSRRLRQACRRVKRKTPFRIGPGRPAGVWFCREN